jgi:molybdopterin-guanine dinucleotide biosynthesis protein B
LKIFSVFGFSKSGKTTTIENLIKELVRRGYSVGSVKDIHFEKFAIDTEGTNTDRHKKAGAELVSARGLYETDILFQSRLPVPELLKFYTQDFVIFEGTSDFSMPRILCSTSMEDIEKRMNDDVFAVSGVISNEISSYKDLPAINSLTDIIMLTDLAEKNAIEWK